MTCKKYKHWCNTRCRNFTLKTKSNQIFHTRSIMPKRVTSLRGPFPRRCFRAKQLFSNKCRTGDKPLITLCPIWPARDLNLRPFAPETNAFPLDQLAGHFGIDDRTTQSITSFLFLSNLEITSKYLLWIEYFCEKLPTLKLTNNNGFKCNWKFAEFVNTQAADSFFS